MKGRTSVHLGKGVPSPLFFPVVGIHSDQSVRVAHLRDWEIFHFPKWKHPVVRIWNTTGQERLFITSIAGEISTHEEALEKIAHWMEVSWKTVRQEYGGVEIPLVAHEHFVIVPEGGTLEEQAGPLLSIEPPCLLFHDWQKPDCREGAVTSTILIAGRKPAH